MLTDYDVLQSPDDKARELILSAFGPIKYRRNVMRNLQRTLKLAEQRGYNSSNEFLDYFRSASQYNPKMVNRLLSNLFEYVSPDEIAFLTRHVN